MNVYYIMNDKYVRMSIKSFIDSNNYNKKRIIQSLKLSLIKKFNFTLDFYLINYLNKEIKKCGFCDSYSDYELEYELEKYKNLLIYEEKSR